jgi:hypothetical protein
VGEEEKAAMMVSMKNDRYRRPLIDEERGSIRRALIDLENHQSIYECIYL